MRHYISLGLILLLSSCASSTNYYPKTVQSWRGGNDQNLIKTWGRPDGMTAAKNGNSILIYKSSSYRPGITASGPDCMAFFEINKQNTIVDTSYQGKRCYRGENFANRMSNHS